MFPIGLWPAAGSAFYAETHPERKKSFREGSLLRPVPRPVLQAARRGAASFVSLPVHAVLAFSCRGALKGGKAHFHEAV